MTASPRQRSLARVLVLTMLSGLLPSQEHTFSSNVKVVSVLATVREKNGTIVRGLAKEDFELSEDGRPQTIRYFSRETDLPLTLGLLVDTGLSQQNVLAEERAASYSFLQSLLRVDKPGQDDDRAFVIHFDFEVELLQDVTSSRRELEAALDELRIPGSERRWQRPQRGGGGGRMPGGRGGGGRGIGTLLYDAVFLGANDVIKPLPGRKALIVLSDGEDHGSQLGIEEAVEAAQRADAVVYTILFTDEDTGLPALLTGGRRRGEGKKVLEQMAKATGGRAFQVSRKLSIRQIYAQIEEELRHQYSLGYSSDQPADKAGYRKISVKTRPNNLTVLARDEYYSHQQVK